MCEDGFESWEQDFFDSAESLSDVADQAVTSSPRLVPFWLRVLLVFGAAWLAVDGT